MTITINPAENTKTAIDYSNVDEAAADTGNYNMNDVHDVISWHDAAGCGPIVNVRGWKRGHFRVKFADGSNVYFTTSGVALFSNDVVAEVLDFVGTKDEWHKGRFAAPIQSTPKHVGVKETPVSTQLCPCGYHNAPAVTECELCGTAL